MIDLCYNIREVISMPVKQTEELLNEIKEKFKDDTSDETLSFIEDVSDTLNDFQTKVSDSTDWKKKYEDNDKEWRQKYKDRFFSGDNKDIDNDIDNDSNNDEPKTFNDLFEIKK